ncbi:MAG: tryptophan 7-halogenase [Planctomycetales bacterium]|nr:tryptophan 7-halogenase [Planctomycetales bacterium]
MSHLGITTAMVTSSDPLTVDCVCIGAGPAGSTTAALVAQHGWKTLLVERDPMPRFHVGESLMPETYWTLERLGVVDELRRRAFTRKQGVQFVTQQGKETRPFFFRQHDDRESSITWHVERADFDQMLFENAQRLGADCRDRTRVTDIHFGEPGEPHLLTLKPADGEPYEVRARVVVDATGQQAMIANRLGLRENYADLQKAAIWGYYRGGARMPDGEAELTTIMNTSDKDSWFWYIPMSGDTVSVGLVSDSDRMKRTRGTAEEIFQQELANCPVLQQRLEHAELVSELRVAKEFSYSTREHAGEGWVLVGDAYGFIDPIYSSGVYLALKSGELAADAIDEGFRSSDLSAGQLAKWCPDFEQGVDLIRRLVRAFYTRPFSFGGFMKEHPQHQSNLTDLLIGRVFGNEAGDIFDDMDPWIRQLLMSESVE